MVPMKLIHRLGMLRIDVAEADVLADDGSVLGFHQAVVPGVMRPRLGLFDQQLVQQTRHVVVDELAAVVGMKAADHEGELFEQRFQHRQQPEFGDLRGRGHDLPLGHLVDGVDVIQPFASILIALMHGVDAQVSRRALRLRLAPFRRWESAWAAWAGSWRCVCDSLPSCATGIGAPPKLPPAAGRQPDCIRCTRVPGCAASPARSGSHAPCPRRPTDPRRPRCSAWRTWCAGRPPLSPGRSRRYAVISRVTCARLSPVIRAMYLRTKPFPGRPRLAYCCRTSVRSTQAYTSSRRCPANRTSPLPARNARICSRLPASESSMLMINPQHPVLPLQAHLV